MRQLARLRCLSCGLKTLRWVPASGEGVLFAYAIVRANRNPSFNHGGPYNIAIVELDEGPQLYTNIVHVDESALRIGMRVRMVCSRLDSGVAVPVFEPLD